MALSGTFNQQDSNGGVEMRNGALFLKNGNGDVVGILQFNNNGVRLYGYGDYEGGSLSIGNASNASNVALISQGTLRLSGDIEIDSGNPLLINGFETFDGTIGAGQSFRVFNGMIVK